jgi:hypothetical protein
LAEDAGYVMTRTETWVHREPLEVCLLAEFVPAS